MKPTLIGSLGCVMLAGCQLLLPSGSDTSADVTSSSGPSATSGAGGAGGRAAESSVAASSVSAASSSSGEACTGVGLPSFQKGCGTSDNCGIALHQIDCCGTKIAFGVNHSEVSPFDQAEQVWEMMCPSCGCSPQPTRAEDGQSGASSDVKVACVNGQCTTYFP
jgi:hypothetical protein